MQAFESQTRQAIWKPSHAPQNMTLRKQNRLVTQLRIIMEQSHSRLVHLDSIVVRGQKSTNLTLKVILIIHGQSSTIIHWMILINRQKMESSGALHTDESRYSLKTMMK